MLLSMRRTEEPDRKRVKIEEQEQEDSGLQQEYFKTLQKQLPGWKIEGAAGKHETAEVSVDESILERLSVCSVTVQPEVERNEFFVAADRAYVTSPNKKRSFVRQFGVREERPESEYVDITQVQQLLLNSATTSGKLASSKNRNSESEAQDCQQQFTQEQGTSRSLSFSESNKTAVRTILRPHSQPSCSSLSGEFSRAQQPFFRSPDRYYQQQGRQIEYFGRVQTCSDPTGRPRMIAEGLPTPPHLQPHLQPPAPQGGGHSPNVEELFALWFGTPSGNAGWYQHL